MPSSTRVMLLLLLSGLMMGCTGGPAKEPTATVSGEVKRMTGEPVGNVTVVLYPTKGQPAVTKTDESGRFSTSAPIGECKVAVIAEASASSTDTSPEATQAMLDAKTKIKPQYANPESSGLAVTVKATQPDKLVFVVE